MNPRKLTQRTVFTALAGLTLGVAATSASAAEILPNGHIDHIHDANKINVIGDGTSGDNDSNRFVDNEDGGFDIWFANLNLFNAGTWNDPYGDGDSNFSLFSGWVDGGNVKSWGGAIAYEWTNPVSVDEVRLYTNPDSGLNMPTSWSFWLKDSTTDTWTQFGDVVDNTVDGTFPQFGTGDYAQNILGPTSTMSVSRMVIKVGDGAPAYISELEVVQVPEPGSLALLGLGGLMFVGRRQRKA